MTTEEKYVDNTINAHKVVVWSKSYCPYCKKTKELFKSLNVDIHVVELDQVDNGDTYQAILKTKTGQSSVPSVWINKQHIGGNDDTQAKHKDGSLQKLLGNEGGDDDEKKDEVQQLLSQQSTVRIGDVTPNFKSKCQKGPIEWHKFIEGKWAILFSHPKDFTPVCTTELRVVADYKKEWAKRNTVVAILSVDSPGDHCAWVEEIEKVFPPTKIDFPVIGDPNRQISLAYGMLDQTMLDDKGIPLTCRSVFMIGPDKKVKLILTYPASTGRSFPEILRCLDSLQVSHYKKVATPADWKRGDPCILFPGIPDDEAKKWPGMEIVCASCKIRTVPDPAVVSVFP